MLSDEQKRQIEAEEAYRLEVRKRLANPPPTPAQQAASPQSPTSSRHSTPPPGATSKASSGGGGSRRAEPTSAVYDYIAKDEADGLHLFVRSYSLLTLGFILGVVSLILFFVGFLALVRSDWSILAASVVTAGLGIFIGSRKVAKLLVITPSTLKARGKTYQLDDINAIGSDSPGAPGMITTGLAALGSVLGEYFNNVVTITYGTRRIVILGGQTQESIAAVRSIIVGYLRKHGRQYGDASNQDVANYLEAAARGRSQDIDQRSLSWSWKQTAVVSLAVGLLLQVWSVFPIWYVLYPLPTWLYGGAFAFVKVGLIYSIVVFVAASIAIACFRSTDQRDLSWKQIAVLSLAAGFLLLTWVAGSVGFNGNAFEFAGIALILSIVIFGVAIVAIASARAIRRAGG